MMPYLYDTQNGKTTKFSSQGFIFQRQRTQPSKREICQREVYDHLLFDSIYLLGLTYIELSSRFGRLEFTSYSRNLLFVDKQLIYSINPILRDK